MSATVGIQGQGTTLSVTTLSPPSTVPVTQLTTIKRSGSKTTIADITNMGSPSAYEEVLATIISPGDMDFAGILNPADTSHVLLQTLQDARSLNVWVITLPNARGTYTFSAYVSELAFDLDFSKALTFSGKLSISGPVVFA